MSIGIAYNPCKNCKEMDKCSICELTYYRKGYIKSPTAEEVVVLPCKVGDIVYSDFHSWKHEDGIVAYQITNITITQNKKGKWTKKYRAMQVKDGKTIDLQLNFDFDEIGKTVFLMKMGAETTLMK